MDSPKYKSTKSAKKYVKSRKVLITQSFFELQTPDFVWKFIYGLSNQVIKYKSTKSRKVQNSTEIKKQKKGKKYKKYKFKNIKRTKST